jgi:hypothetical protein
VAYVGPTGISIVDLSNGLPRSLDIPDLADLDWGVSPHRIWWVNEDREMLLHSSAGVFLVDVATGAILYEGPWAYGLSPSPSLRLFVGARGEDGSSTTSVSVFDVASRSWTGVPSATMASGGLAFGPVFRFSDDESRVCWVASPSELAAVRCAGIPGGPVEMMAPPHQFEPHVSASGHRDHLWVNFSFDLERVTYTVPGLEDAAAPQTLWATNIDGSAPAEFGPALPVIAVAWRPQGVYHPPGYTD